MICDNCKKDKLVTDFIINQKYCFSCEYQEKLIKIREKRNAEQFCCRICEKTFVLVENAKKRQRTIFCSKECALKGHKEIKENHWTRIVRARKTL
jgi:hypothetical protein